MACVYREMAMRSAELKDYVFQTLYIGGGTPSVKIGKLAVNRRLQSNGKAVYSAL